MIRMNISILALSALALSACGSGSANLSSEFTTLVDEAERLATRLEDFPDVTPALVGTGGSYDGVVVMAEDLDASVTGVIGQVNLAADFGTGEINGSASNFYQTGIVADGTGTVVGTGTAVAGSLDLNRPASAIDPIFALGVDGSVTLEGTSRPISGNVLGVFFGPDAEMVAAFGEAGVIGLDLILIAD